MPSLDALPARSSEQQQQWAPQQYRNPHSQDEWPRPVFDAYAPYGVQPPYAAQPAAYGPPHQGPAYASPRPVWGVPPYPGMFLVSRESNVDEYRSAFATGPYARGPYRCRRCGQMKRLHRCTYSVDQRSVFTQTYPLSITTTTKLITVSSSRKARIDDDAEVSDGNPSESSRTSSYDGSRKRVRFEDDVAKDVDATRKRFAPTPSDYPPMPSDYPRAAYDRPDVTTALPRQVSFEAWDNRLPVEAANSAFII